MKTVKTLLAAVVAIFCLSASLATFAVQYNHPRAGNPIVPGYFADPCLRKFGDTYYLYATPDGWGVGEGPFCIWSSKDFVHWTATPITWPHTPSQKWAPSVLVKNGTYYMYNQVPCMVYVATASNPLGPWTNPLASDGVMLPDQTPSGTIVLDGEVFIDDDGQAYIYYGTWWTPTVMKLNSDLISYDVSTAIQFFAHTGYTPPNGTVQGCMEAPYMLKHNGKYYYMYSNNSCFDSTYDVEYSVGNSPMGPWTYGANNPILSTNIDDTVDGPGHHTIMEDGGKVYICYHRHDNPHNADGVHRQVAVDELVFNADGSIAKVVPTHDSIGYLAASTKKDTNIAIGKTATASSSAGSDWIPAYAADENNGTMWKASSYSYPQWLTIDLGSSMSFKRCETEFQFPQFAYKYKIEYSTNGSTWTTFADRSANTSVAGAPMTDSVGTAVSGRYVRITMSGDNYGSRPSPEIGIWNFKVYDGVDKADPTPVVDAGPDKIGTMTFPTLPLSGVLVYATGPVTYNWSQVSGPGTVTFTNATTRNATATFPVAGTYVIQFSANDGTRTGTDNATYTIQAAGDKIVQYPMDEASGVYVTDTSNNNQDGILMNGPTRGTGAVNRCVNFDGSNDYMYLPALTTANALTLAAWVKPDTLVGYGSILCGNGSATGTPYFSIKSDGKVHFEMVGNSSADVSGNYTFTGLNLAKWTHIGVAYDKTAKTVSFYINGALDVTRSLTTAQTATLTAGAQIGGWNGGGRYFDGKIDELVLYNRALSAAEITTLASGVTFTKVSDAKALADGQTVSLKATPVTYAPTNASVVRNTTSFYIEDSDGLNGLRVEDGTSGQDAVIADSGATISGTMRTNATTTERYLELSALPEVDSAPVLTPATKTLANVNGDAIVGLLVKISSATIVSIAGDRKSMVIQDGTSTNTTVTCEYGTIDTDLAATNQADITGIVGQTSATTRVIYLKSYWRTNPPIDMMTYKLQEYYRFNESSGTSAADSSGNNRNATMSNITWAAGKYGNAAQFNGTSSTGVIPDMGTYPAITIAGWMNLSSLNDWQAIMHCDNWTTNAVHLSFRGGGDLFFSVGGNDPVDVSSGSVYNSGSLNTWKWVAVVYDSVAKTVKFYVNGAFFAQTNYNTAMTCNLTGMHIGSWNAGSRFYGGLMDELRFYGRALTDAEINTLYNTGSTTITSSTGTGGTISPSGDTVVAVGGSQTYTITPNAGYDISAVTVDGTNIGAVSTYTFTNVSASHTISATFAASSTNPVALYKFENDVLDFYGGYNGTAYNTPTYVAGKIGSNAIQFNGSNQYVSSARPVQDDFTIAFWMKTSTAGAGTTNYYSGKCLVNCYSGSTTNTFGISYLANNLIAFGVGASAGTTTIQSTSTVNSGSWVHVACTRNATSGEMKVYINGTLEKTGTGPTGTKSATANIHLGKRQNSTTATYYYNGAMDQLKFYGAVLSQTQIQALVNEGITYTITASAGSNGSISPTGTVNVSYGANQTFTITPNSGYIVSQVAVDGVNQGALTGYTFSNVTANHTISATFATIPTYTITASAGANGSISPSGAVPVVQGANQSFTITPNSGYIVSQVTVDGVNQGAITTYAFNNVTANHTIAATFVVLPTYTITASAGANGSISPTGAVSVNQGANQSFTITPNAGYMIDTLTVDGSTQTSVSSYTFSNVTANHTISVTFKVDPYADMVAYLKFDETSGTTAADTSGKGNSAALNGGYTWVTGKLNNAVNLNGTTGYASLPGSLLSSVNDFTISSWVNLTTNATANRLFDFGTGSSTYMYLSPNGAAGKVRYAIKYNGGTEQLIDGTSALSTSSWQYVAITLSGTTATLYVNGVQVGQNTSMTLRPSDLGPTTQNWIGRSQSADSYLKGMVDDFRIYNRALSATEIQNQFNAASPYIITASADANGSINPSGIVSVNAGASQTFTITPNSSYAVYQVLVDGVNQGAVTSYTFTNVTANHTISASFSLITRTITASAGAGGTISPSGSVLVPYGSSQTFTITPNTGFSIQNVVIDSISMGAIGSYTFNNVLANHTISATFSQITFTITASAGTGGTITPSGSIVVNYGANQVLNIAANAGYAISSVLVDGVNVGAQSSVTFNNITANHTVTASFIRQYTITASAGANGSISPSGSVLVNTGTNKTFNISANTGYSISQVTVDGVNQGAISTYTFSNVTADHTISAAFNVNTFTITASSGTGGSISPSGSVSVDYGTNKTFTITPNTGYSILNVKVDGADQGAIGSYTFSNVTAAHTISATFAKITFTITSSAEANGTISPIGSVSVDYGTNKTFTITPNDGFTVADVLADSTSVGAVTSYLFSNVTANHTILAKFKLNGKPFGVGNQTVIIDPGIVGKLVKTWGKVKSVGSTSFTISDGNSSAITVNFNGITPPANLNTKYVIVTGLVNPDKTIKAYIIDVY